MEKLPVFYENRLYKIRRAMDCDSKWKGRIFKFSFETIADQIEKGRHIGTMPVNKNTQKRRGENMSQCAFRAISTGGMAESNSVMAEILDKEFKKGICARCGCITILAHDGFCSEACKVAFKQPLFKSTIVGFNTRGKL